MRGRGRDRGALLRGAGEYLSTVVTTRGLCGEWSRRTERAAVGGGGSGWDWTFVLKH